MYYEHESLPSQYSIYSKLNISRQNLSSLGSHYDSYYTISFLKSKKLKFKEYSNMLFHIYPQFCPKKAVIYCTYCDLCPDQQHWSHWAEGWRASGPVWWPSPSLEPPPCRLPKRPEQGYGSDCRCSPLHSRPWWLWWSQSSEGYCPGPDYCSLWTVLPEGSRTKGFPMVEWSDKKCQSIKKTQNHTYFVSGQISPYKFNQVRVSFFFFSTECCLHSNQ